MRVLGIDPGLATIGIGVIDTNHPNDLRVHEWLIIQTVPGKTLSERLHEIHEDLSAYIDQTKPDLAVIEKLYFAKNETTAFDVSHARGVILLALQEHALPILEPTPMQLKSAIAGDGKADKKQMQQMLKLLLQLEEIPKPDDAADALALAIYGALQHQTIAAI